MSKDKPKKKLPRWLQKFQDEIPNGVLRGDQLFVRVSYTNEAGIKKSFEQLCGVPSKTNFSELSELAFEIRKELRETVKQKKEGAFNDLEKQKITMTFGEYLDIWLAAVFPGLGTRTKYEYEKTLKNYIRQPLGKMLLTRVTSEHLKKVFDAMIKKGISRQTENARQVVLIAMNYAIEHGYYDGLNPCKKIKLPKKKHREIVAMDKAQARKFIAACRESENGMLFEFALKTGMRPEEYLALQWKDIDFESGSIQVRRKVVLTSTSNPVFEETKTKSSRRLIPLGDDLITKLKKHRSAQKKHIEKFKDFKNLHYRNFNLIFPSSTGTPFGPQNLLRRFFRPILKKAELEDLGLTVYSLRHTMATLLLLAGENPKVVSERLGHSSIAITLDTYSHVIPTMQTEASRKLTEMLD